MPWTGGGKGRFINRSGLMLLTLFQPREQPEVAETLFSQENYFSDRGSIWMSNATVFIPFSTYAAISKFYFSVIPIAYH